MNDIEVKINGERVDIDPNNVVAADFQTNDIGDLSQMKADVTSTITLLDTARNHRIMKNAATLGSNATIQLGKINASVLFRGLPLMANGKAYLKGAKKGEYSINILSGNYDLFDSLKDKKLSDFDFSAYNLNMTPSDYRSHYLNTSGVCYPIQHTGDFFWQGETEANHALRPDNEIHMVTQVPHFYIKSIINEIISQSGFTKTGAMFSEERYDRMVLSLVPPSGTMLVGTGLRTIKVKDWMPDILAVDFIKILLTMFGAFISTIENTVYFIQIKENYENEPRDWSAKYDSSEEPSIAWEISYAQTNKFKHAPDINDLGEVIRTSVVYDVDYDIEDDEILSDNLNLSLEKTVIETPVEPSRVVEIDPTRNAWPWLPCHNYAGVSGGDIYDFIIAGSYDIFLLYVKMSFEPQYVLRFFVMVDYTDGNTYDFWTTNNIGASSRWFSSTTIRTCYFSDLKLHPTAVASTPTNLQLGWTYLLNDYWFPIENSMLKNPTKVVAKFNLTAADTNAGTKSANAKIVRFI